ncbi:preprotein translocase subunit SecY [Adlercreutzia caecimuris]|uniref:Protein translocase subunit SecY n=2 Tax=Adlercreutzia caecimuris TaxID=671266 RepID=R9KWH2_9ACTN|nr:preprotein translocase subunit SecY [Adlercreutzia caecimuris]EOS50576.1 preprotein translocase, SecY subunit [Adlercreutzia caecimuris B7]MCI9208338.1 preprotein translocase subunit SecY [Adlercreutzia caecimuris]MCR2038166.1 preprotein translocase subunit SecY [Adlercreutzia caecimuris]NBJ65818.1 preprotein translocase subunit SecY [Adlercreutzia caecimuris]THG38727.1 preprotein translocase subunit SecY [Adlercreutzia caecimuris]
MLRSILDAFKVPELRKKILFTLAILALYRFGAYVPVPGIPFHEFATAFQDTGVAMTMLDLFTGGALSNFSVFSLGIMPYITASIIMQLMQGVIPAVGRWAREGDTGRRKITQVTRYLTLGLGLINAVGYLLLFKSPAYGVQFSTEVPEALTNIIIVFTLVAGTAFIMWMGELITQRGIGNGMSLIIFVSIVSRVPSAIFSSVNLTSDLGTGIALTLVILAVVLVCIPLIIFVERAQRRIPVNYAKRVQGRKMMGGQSTYIPLKVNAAGVIPIIFASCLIYFPAQLAAIFNVDWLTTFANWCSTGWLNWLLTVLLIVFFAYFYTSMVFNPEETADNIRKQGGFIPGVRPGTATVQYIKNVINRVTLPGGIFIAAIAVVPTIIFYFTNNQLIQAFGGTSILIMIGVALDTMSKIESQLKMYNYEGFFK